MSSLRKIALMHEIHGVKPMHKCGDCSNFISGRYHDRILRKCKRYGLTHSEATDWAKSWTACGILNIPLPDGEKTVIEVKKMSRRVREAQALEGQVML